MKKLIFIPTLLVLLTGCINDKVITSYKNYQNTIGKEYKEYLNKGIAPNGKRFTEQQIKARLINLESAKLLIEEAENAK